MLLWPKCLYIFHAFSILWLGYRFFALDYLYELQMQSTSYTHVFINGTCQILQMIVLCYKSFVCFWCHHDVVSFSHYLFVFLVVGRNNVFLGCIIWFGIRIDILFTTYLYVNPFDDWLFPIQQICFFKVLDRWKDIKGESLFTFKKKWCITNIINICYKHK